MYNFNNKEVIKASIQIVLISIVAYIIAFYLPSRGTYLGGSDYYEYTGPLIIGASAYGIHYLVKNYYKDM